MLAHGQVNKMFSLGQVNSGRVARTLGTGLPETVEEMGNELAQGCLSMWITHSVVLFSDEGKEAKQGAQGLEGLIR